MGVDPRLDGSRSVGRGLGRRRLLTILGFGTAALATRWSRPLIESVVVPLHAQSSPPAGPPQLAGQWTLTATVTAVQSCSEGISQAPVASMFDIPVVLTQVGTDLTGTVLGWPGTGTVTAGGQVSFVGFGQDQGFNTDFQLTGQASGDTVTGTFSSAWLTTTCVVSGTFTMVKA